MKADCMAEEDEDVDMGGLFGDADSYGDSMAELDCLESAQENFNISNFQIGAQKECIASSSRSDSEDSM